MNTSKLSVFGIFTGLGPLGGLLVLLVMLLNALMSLTRCTSDCTGDYFSVVPIVFLVLVFSYIFGLIPSTLAAYIFSYLIQKVPQPQSGLMMGLIGLASGALATMAAVAVYLVMTRESDDGMFVVLTALGAGSGFFCGLLVARSARKQALGETV